VVLDSRLYGCGDEADSWVGDRSRGGVNLRANVGQPIVTNGEFAVLRPLSKSLWDFVF